MKTARTEHQAIYPAIMLSLILWAGSVHGSRSGDHNQEYYSLSHYYKDQAWRSEKEGNYPEALKLFKLYDAAKDSLKALERKNDLMLLEQKYRNETKAVEVFLLMKEKSLKEAGLRKMRYSVYAVAGVIMIAFLLILLIMNRMRLQAGRQELTTRQYLLLAQMNPHFIFNALTNIQSLIMQRDPVTSGKFLDLFARLTLRIREHSEMELVRLEEEFSLIRDYIELQKLRYGDKFDWEFSVSDSVKQYNFVIPPMLLQPTVENAIEHGLKYREGKGLVTFRIAVSGEKELTVEIEDDGIGREKAMEIARQNPGHHQGLATKITRERIEQLNKRKRRKFLFEINDKRTDSGEPSGTIVKFIFPQMILK